MDMKEHAKKSTEQHKAMADAHENLASACDEEGYSKMAEACRKVAAIHATRAKHYGQMHDYAANKAVIDELAKSRAALEPQRVSGVVPDNPTLRAVPRYGAKPFATAVDEEFQFLVSSGDDRT